jgi:hypothetical protein
VRNRVGSRDRALDRGYVIDVGLDELHGLR